jgi:hypothetical protein
MSNTNWRSLKNWSKKRIFISLAILLTVAGVAGSLFYYQASQNTPAKKAQAAELVTQVTAKPEAGIEAVDIAKLEKSFKLFKVLPSKPLVQAELDSQLKEKYITQRQHDQFLKIYDLSQTQESLDFKDLQAKSEKGEF